MSGPAPGGGAEVLELGGPSRARRGPSWSRRTWTVLGVVTALLLAGAWLVEDRWRGSSEAALERCRSEAAEQVAAAERSLASMADYLRPGLLTVPAQARDSLYVAMSEAAVDDLPRVQTALDTCRAVDPSWVHPDLQRRRDDYVDHLARRVDLLEGVVADGRSYYRDDPELEAERERLFGTG
ncbi:hypothetical protein G7072_05760 [Nocardioides sp. HDW12B]|uniref:hypothetical protein n=1 Tax=Nocardioides sp. HDW12B TaxID=2714939 RepID=UPI00140B054B|nr:hypothetical protein [Nocardioides sp. HDW12B]QIK65908.1 hypothetical protein G7072_05760 [Nocardioides sp. HDW12B]